MSSNYISSTINGGSVFIKGRIIHVERYGVKYTFPLKGSRNSVSMSTSNDSLIINGYEYDLDNLGQYEELRGRKQYHKTESPGIFSRILSAILEVFD